MATEDDSPFSRFTCITCRVAFRDAAVQRSHYKTDWHRYNLKRKVAELPPVTTEGFKEKVLAQSEVTNAASESKVVVCTVCKKHFTSQNSHENHLRSKKHRDVASSVKTEEGSDTTTASAEAVQKDDQEEVLIESEGEPEALDIAECLFCPHESGDMEQSLNHMSKVHGFFIPELEYVADIKGLIEYLCEKVGVGYVCLYCNERGKAFNSVESVQQHMVDKCHCKVFFEGNASLEYAEYYDYSKSYPDFQGADEKRGHSEGVSDEEVGDHPGSTPMEVTDSLELVLPSGAKVGHRALKLFYKQRLPTQEQRKSALVSRMISQYRALGWKESAKGEVGMLRQRDEAWGRKMQTQRNLRLSVKANKFQPHFRPQVIF